LNLNNFVESWLGILQTTGPEAEPDYSDERYWFKRAYVSNVAGDAHGDLTVAAYTDSHPRYLWSTATNLAEMGGDTHYLTAGMYVQIFVFRDHQIPGVRRYLFCSSPLTLVTGLSNGVNTAYGSSEITSSDNFLTVAVVDGLDGSIDLTMGTMGVVTSLTDGVNKAKGDVEVQSTDGTVVVTVTNGDGGPVNLEVNIEDPGGLNDIYLRRDVLVAQGDTLIASDAETPAVVTIGAENTVPISNGTTWAWGDGTTLFAAHDHDHNVNTEGELFVGTEGGNTTLDGPDDDYKFLKGKENVGGVGKGMEWQYPVLRMLAAKPANLSGQVYIFTVVG
jgi:hypothetical protein